MEQLGLVEEIKFYEKGRAPFTANSVHYVDVTKLKLRLTLSRLQNLRLTSERLTATLLGYHQQ